jgi:hypothetical protein
MMKLQRCFWHSLAIIMLNLGFSWRRLWRMLSCDVTPCSLVEFHRRFGEHTASIFSVEENVKRATSKKQAIERASCMWKSWPICWPRRKLRGPTGALRTATPISFHLSLLLLIVPGLHKTISKPGFSRVALSARFLLIVRLALSYSLKMEAIFSPETSIYLH